MTTTLEPTQRGAYPPSIIGGRGSNRRTRAARFWQNVRLTDIDDLDSCWLWMASRHPRGYGILAGADWGAKAHRFAYQLLIGPIPDGLEIDHVCGVRHCVNPDHLEAVTHAENLARMRARTIPSSCPRGHEFTPENTYRRPVTVARVCRACAKDRG